jgi:hypothetical protein
MEWLEELHAMTQVLGSNYFRVIMRQVGGGFSGLKHDILLFLAHFWIFGKHHHHRFMLPTGGDNLLSLSVSNRQ